MRRHSKSGLIVLHHQTILAAALCLILWVAPAAAQTLIDGSDVDGVLSAAREFGSAAVSHQENGDPMIIGRIDGISYFVRFRNCANNQACHDINLRVGFQIKPTLDQINEWNRDKRFSRAYLDGEGDAILEMDAILGGGVSRASVSEIFAYWRLSMNQFTAHIGCK